ncbi:hypothetical protein CYMTET_32279 [Cymbomonas tetramitiformis]|uniref:PH domain-containing protein n=1 Tax=Cymbomonas tetramitiformis TaxID=36881 RepID=A0AAE0FFL7_9CHLO|nr:hypothetical protein CYMTET_32279 [Cymbomonas tetramitiformis]
MLYNPKIREGFLLKKGGSKVSRRENSALKSNMFGRHNWKRRYFIIDDVMLRYYTDPFARTPLGELDLYGCTVRRHAHEHFTHCFALKVQARPAEMLLSAETEETTWAWMSAINDASYYAPLATLGSRIGRVGGGLPGMSWQVFEIDLETRVKARSFFSTTSKIEKRRGTVRLSRRGVEWCFFLALRGGRPAEDNSTRVLGWHLKDEITAVKIHLYCHTADGVQEAPFWATLPYQLAAAMKNYSELEGCHPVYLDGAIPNINTLPLKCFDAENTQEIDWSGMENFDASVLEKIENGISY